MVMAFDEVQFPTNISYGSRGGPKFMVDIVRQENGHEQRVNIWGDAINSYNARYGVKKIADLAAVLNFFYARQGQTRGFRYKDWFDFVATQETMVVDGSNQLQLIKNYTSGSETHRRTIRKPLASPAVTMRRNTAAFTDFTLDLTTGIATLTAPDGTNGITSSSAHAISAISLANPAVVTSAVNDFIDNDYIVIAGAASNGMVELPDGQYLINQLTTTTFELVGIDSTLFTAYDGTGATAQMPGISRSNPARVRSIAHGFSTSTIIYIHSVVGMTEINGLFAAITIDGVDRFDIAIDSSLFTAYSSGGTAEQHLQPGTDTMDWTGEFDVPVRFNMEDLQISYDAFEFGNIPDIPLMELLSEWVFA
jgi:uncharacterized protein (TIGR02217 family)